MTFGSNRYSMHIHTISRIHVISVIDLFIQDTSYLGQFPSQL